MPSKEKYRQVKTITELAGKEKNWKNHIRIIKPPGGESHDVLGLTRLPPHYTRGIRIVPPREILFPPEPKRVTLIKQRARDRASSATKRCIAPDCDRTPVTESENNLAFGAGTLKLPAATRRIRTENDSSRVKVILDHSGAFTSEDEKIEKALGQNGTNPSRFWPGCGSTKRRPPTCNDSSGVKKLLFRWNPDEHAKKQSAMKELLPRKTTAGFCRDSSYSHNLGEALHSSRNDSVVWQPGRRLAYQFLMAKGFHAKKWEDDSLQRLLNKQRRNLTYSHHHWKSSVFATEPEHAVVGCKVPPYVYHNILWDGPKGVVYKFGKKCRSTEDIRNPVTGESVLYNRRRSLFVNNSRAKTNEKEKNEKIQNPNQSETQNQSASSDTCAGSHKK